MFFNYPYPIQWCQQCDPRARCDPQRQEMWPADGLKIGIEVRLASFVDAGRNLSFDITDLIFQRQIFIHVVLFLLQV